MSKNKKKVKGAVPVKEEKIYNIFIFVLFALFFLSTAFLIDVKHYRLKLIAMEIGALTFIVVFLMTSVFKKMVLWKKSPLDLWVALFFGYVLIRYLTFSDKNVARMEMEKNFLCFGLFFGISQNILKQQVKKILKIFAISAILVAIYGLWQNFGTPVWVFNVPHISPPYATFGNQNFFAAYLVIALPMAFLFLKEKNGYLKFIGFAGVLIFALGLYYAGSRGGILAAFAGVMVFLLAKYGKRIKYLKIILVLVLLCALAAGYLKRSFWLRDTHRKLIWQDTIRMALKNPFGVGPGAFASSFPDYASDKLKKVYPQNKFIVNFAHNEYLEIFSELGLPGLFLFLMIIVTFFRKSKNPYLLASAAGILVHNIFSVNMRFIISAGFLYFIFAVFRAENSEDRRINLEGSAPVIPFVLAAALTVFFVPQIFKPIKALKITSSEPDFFEDVKAEEIKKLENKLSANPKDYDTLYRIGWFYAKKKNFRTAVDYFMKASEVRPTPGLWNNIGNIFFETGDRPRAIQAYKNALSMNPELIDAHFNLGYTYFYEGRLGESAACFNEVLKRDKNNAKAIVMLEKMKE
ncbi:MAG: O-antigen ligase family protein [bacterium]